MVFIFDILPFLRKLFNSNVFFAKESMSVRRINKDMINIDTKTIIIVITKKIFFLLISSF